jgi:hypothetical protein
MQAPYSIGHSKVDDQQLGVMQRSSSASTINVFALFQLHMDPRHPKFEPAEATLPTIHRTKSRF